MIYPSSLEILFSWQHRIAGPRLWRGVNSSRYPKPAFLRNLSIRVLLMCLFLLSLQVSYAQDQAALQRGAGVYMNYCSGCHALRYMRYNRLAEDLGLLTFSGQVDKTLLKNNLIFTKATPEDPIEISMPMTAARQWFGVEPPDLSLIARVRGAAWLSAYLKGFYEDKRRPFGSNNVVFPEVAMPDVFAPLRGTVQRDKHGQLLLINPGQISTQELDQMIQDVVYFLGYVAEPMYDLRQKIGLFVLAYFALLIGVVYSLKRRYWKKR